MYFTEKNQVANLVVPVVKTFGVLVWPALAR